MGMKISKSITQAEILIDKDEEGDEEIDVLLCIIWNYLTRKMLLKVTQFNKPPVSNSAPSRLSPQGQNRFC